MKRIMNITTCLEDTARYRDRADFAQFLRRFRLDGVEIMQVGQAACGVITPQDAVGVHLRYYPGWMDFWRGDEARLMLEYGDWSACEARYGGRDASALVDAYRENFRFVNAMQPEYMVLHVSDCSMVEAMRRKYHYSDEAVVDATADLMNQAMDALQTEPWLLYENLWYPGLTLLRPEMVRRLMEKTAYQKCGVMLDTGHVMHTNLELQTPEEAVDYIHQVLDRYGDLSWIKGIHLSQSLTGRRAKALMEHWQPVKGDYQTRIWEVMGHIFEIDTHRPFATGRINELIRRIDPEFLVLELISGSRQEHEKLLAEQLEYLNAQ